MGRVESVPDVLFVEFNPVTSQQLSKLVLSFCVVPEGLPKIAQAFKPGTGVRTTSESRRDGRKASKSVKCQKLRCSRPDEARNYGHGGGAPGMNTILRVYPESGQSVIVLGNLDPPTASRMGDWLDARMPLK